MAKITLDLNRFKASGVYTVEFDASERIVISTQTIRLIVGFSRTGPFNAPVFLRDIRQSRRIFGTIDSKLEARGSFFHRAIETCLAAGPIFALNLLALNNVPVTEGGDAVDYRSFALAANEANGNNTRALYASFYNKERFWFPDVEYLQATVDSKAANAGRLFNVVNLGQQVNSVIIRKSVNASKYNLPADEYYDADSVPAYVYGKDYMSDYFVDVYVVKGDWTNYSSLSKDPLYSKYFDLRGLISDKLETFLSLDGITMIGAFTGCIIPNFIDNAGSNQSIDIIVNNNVAITGLFLNINENALMDYDNSKYKVDMIGNTLIDTTDDTIDFLSYNTPIKSTLAYSSKIVDYTLGLGDTDIELVTQDFDPNGSSVAPYVKSFPYGGTSGKFGNVLVLPKPVPSDTVFTPAQWEALGDNLTKNSLIKTFGTSTITNSGKPNDFVKVENVINTGSELLIQLSTPLHTDVNYQSTNDVAEDNYIIETTASAVPTVANTIVVNNFVTGDAISTIGSTTQATTKGQPIATLTAPVTNTITGATDGVYAGVAQLSTTGTGSGATFGVTVAGGLVTGVTLTALAPGVGYKTTDVITINTTTFLGAGSGTLTISPATLVPVTYSGVTSTSVSGGSGATFDVAYSASGSRTVTVANGGQGYSVSDAIVIPLAQVGGAPAVNITFTVSAVTAGPSVDTGDIILVEAPGYAKYFEVNTVTTGSGTTSITVKTTLTSGDPYYIDKWAVSGFASDEFAAYQQPSVIKVTLFDVTEAAAQYLWADLGINSSDSFGYILEPQAAFNSILGLGQTAVNATENEVLVYDNTGTAPALIAGTWYIEDGSSTFPGVDTNKYVSGTANADFGKVRIVGTANANPFAALSVGDDIIVNLPNGNAFNGKVASASGTINTTTYNLDTTDIYQYMYVEAYPGSKLAKNIKGSLMVDGDRVQYDSGSSQFNYLNVTQKWSKTISEYSKIAYGLIGSSISEFADTDLEVSSSNFVGVDNTFLDGVIVDGTNPNNEFVVYSSQAKNIKDNVAIDGTLYGGGKKFKLTATNANKIQVGDFLVNNDVDSPKLIRVITKVKKLDPALGTPFYEYTILEAPKVSTVSGINYVTRFTPIQKFADRFQFTALSGFKMTDFHLPGTPAQLEKILSVLELTNVGVTLESKDVIQYRYVVDTFNGGLEPHMGPKQYLSRLAMKRQQCMAILNSPSMAEFQASTDPRFTELPDAATGNPKPVLNTEYISTGGNLTLGPSFTWSLPDEENGAKFIGVFTPNIIIREDGKNKSIPPAADVSNNFIRKFINGEPYGIVAGPRRGVISNPKFVKMEYDFLLKDREFLEPAGLNPIVVVRNVGPMIFANQTAYQRTLSAFNNLHVRDLLITIEEGVIEILQNYLFEFNDASTRLEIRTTVETYLDVIRTAGGIYAYSVIMDDTNNTPEIIDQNFGILDIGIEPARGLQKFVNRITVLKTGAIAAGGFAAV